MRILSLILLFFFSSALIFAEEEPQVRVEIPIADYKVNYAEGHFESYSFAPEAGDQITLDINELIKKKASTLYFRNPKQPKDAINLACYMPLSGVLRPDIAQDEYRDKPALRLISSHGFTDKNSHTVTLEFTENYRALRIFVRRGDFVQGLACLRRVEAEK